MKHIKDGIDRAADFGLANYRDLIRYFTALHRAEMLRYNLFAPAGTPQRKLQEDAATALKDWSGNVNELARPVNAELDGERWLGQCDVCGSREIITPTDPIFFCHQCQNVEFNSDARPVIFQEVK